MKWGTAYNADFGPYQSTVKFRNGLDSSAENLFDARDVNNFKGFSCFSGLSILLR